MLYFAYPPTFLYFLFPINLSRLEKKRQPKDPTMKYTHAKVTTILAALFMLPALTAHADATPALQLNNVQLGVTGATQGGGSSFGPILKYLPQYNLLSGEHLVNVGLDLGVTSFNNAGNSDFLILQYGVFGTYQFSTNWEARMSVGAQTWTAGNGTAFYFGPEAVYHFNEKIWGVVDGLFLSYNAVLQSNFANLFSAGINFKF
jgi:hypothetical protein